MQVPKRAYTLEELRLNKIEPEKFLSPEDKTLNQIRTILQVIPPSFHPPTPFILPQDELLCARHLYLVHARV